LTPSEKREGLRLYYGFTAIQHSVGKYGHILRGCKDPGMARDTSEHAGVFILNLALNYAMAKNPIVGCGHDSRMPGRRGQEGGARHSQGAENLALTEKVQAFIRYAFEQMTQNDKPDVTVFGSRPWIRRERNAESSRQQFFLALVLQKKFLVCRQARRVCQKHADADALTSPVIACERGKQRNDGRIEIEQAAFIKNHRSRCGANHFAHGCKIEDAGVTHKGRIWLAGEMSEGIQGHQLSLEGNRQGRPREGTLCHRPAEHGESTIKNGFLLGESRQRKQSGLGDVLDARFIAKFWETVKQGAGQL